MTRFPMIILGVFGCANALPSPFWLILVGWAWLEIVACKRRCGFDGTLRSHTTRANIGASGGGSGPLELVFTE